MSTYADPRILRAIAHPVRNRVLQELTAIGPMRAADVAERLDIPANQASFHLRQLAKYGLIELDPEASTDKRNRVWRAVDEDGVSFNTADMAAQPGGPAAVAVFKRQAEAQAVQLVRAAYADAPAEESPRGRRSITEFTLMLDNESAAALERDLTEVLHRHLALGRQQAADPGRRSWSYLAFLQPVPPGAETPTPE